MYISVLGLTFLKNNIRNYIFTLKESINWTEVDNVMQGQVTADIAALNQFWITQERQKS